VSYIIVLTFNLFMDISPLNAWNLLRIF